MVRYANGRIPDSELVSFKSGGESFRSTPASVRRWLNLVADCQKLYGVTLTITSGPNAYRSYASQVAMKLKYTLQGKPMQAAAPGTSSHGGNYNGTYTGYVRKDSSAFDVNNWQSIGWTKFSALAHKHGFSTNVVQPKELWHIVDFNPWTMPASTKPEQVPTPAPLPIPPIEEKDEDDMANPSQVHYVEAVTGNVIRSLFVPGTAYWVPFNEGKESTIANAFAKNLPTGSSTLVTKALFDVMASRAAALLPKA
jgi:hypothetical protein